MNKKILFLIMFFIFLFNNRHTISAQADLMPPNLFSPIDLEKINLKETPQRAKTIIQQGAEGIYNKINEYLPQKAQKDLEQIKTNLERETVKQQKNLRQQKWFVNFKYKFNQYAEKIKIWIIGRGKSILEKIKQQIISELIKKLQQ